MVRKVFLIFWVLIFVVMAQPIEVQQAPVFEVPVVDPITGGAFLMGSSSSDPNAYFFEQPQHAVAVDSFSIGIYEISNREYADFLNDGNGVHYDEGAFTYLNPITKSGATYVYPQEKANHPALYVDFAAANAYCQWLSNKTGDTYRLPTEAEWEYACRAGTTTKYYWGDSPSADYARYGVRDQEPLPVGYLLPNAWEIYDMSGNAAEWCSDWYSSEYYSQSSVLNPQGPSTGLSKVLRGGSWYYDATQMKSASRLGALPQNLSMSIGFRILKVTADSNYDVTVSAYQHEVGIGAPMQLSASTSQSLTENYNWTSSDPTVATVDSNGLVTGVSSGLAVIAANGQTTHRTGIFVVTVGSGVQTEVSITPSRATTYVGSIVELTATTTGLSESYTWSSSDTSVATVSNGTVTGITPGVVSITAVGQTTGLSDTITITIYTIVEGYNIRLNLYNVQMSLGSTFKLIATTTNIVETYTWSSSDDSVARVDSTGLIWALSAGTETVTVTGDTTGETTSAQVTISDLPDGYHVVVNPSSEEIDIGDTLQLSAKSFDGNRELIGDTYTWSSDNTSVATVDSNGMVTAIATGSATITALSGQTSEEGSANIIVNDPNRLNHYLPFLVSDGVSWSSELYLLNTTEELINVNLIAYDEQGNQIGSYYSSLNSRQRQLIDISASSEDWTISVGSSGFFSVEAVASQKGLEVVGMVVSLNTESEDDIVVMESCSTVTSDLRSFHVDSGGSNYETYIVLKNLENNEQRVTLTLYDFNGNTTSVTSATIPPNGIYFDTPNNAFVGFSGRGWIDYSGTGNIDGKTIYLNMINSRMSLAAVPMTIRRVQNYVLPFGVHAPGLWTTILEITNYGSENSNVSVSAYTEGGAQIGSDLSIAINSRSKYEVIISDETFGSALSQIFSMKFVTDGDIYVQGVYLNESSNTEGDFIVAPANPVESTKLVTIAIKNDQSYQTFFAIVNPGAINSTVTYNIYNESGALISSLTDSLPAGAMVFGNVTEYIEGANVSSGWMSVEADSENIAGQVMYLNVLNDRFSWSSASMLPIE